MQTEEYHDFIDTYTGLALSIAIALPIFFGTILFPMFLRPFPPPEV